VRDFKNRKKCKKKRQPINTNQEEENLQKNGNKEQRRPEVQTSSNKPIPMKKKIPRKTEERRVEDGIWHKNHKKQSTSEEEEKKNHKSGNPRISSSSPKNHTNRRGKTVTLFTRKTTKDGQGKMDNISNNRIA
jgi:hypothetical protein